MICILRECVRYILVPCMLTSFARDQLERTTRPAECRQIEFSAQFFEYFVRFGCLLCGDNDGPHELHACVRNRFHIFAHIYGEGCVFFFFQIYFVSVLVEKTEKN